AGGWVRTNGRSAAHRFRMRFSFAPFPVVFAAPCFPRRLPHLVRRSTTGYFPVRPSAYQNPSEQRVAGSRSGAVGSGVNGIAQRSILNPLPPTPGTKPSSFILHASFLLSKESANGRYAQSV